jgi:SAM-dependent methyltransferase
VSIIHGAHKRLVHPRRVNVLVARLAPLLPSEGQILDVGCGDGLIAHLLNASRPSAVVHGIDVLVRPGSHIPVAKFDGDALPYSDGSFDAVLLVDVLHHSADPQALLAEAVRVSRSTVVIKDHLRDARLAGARLRLMDRVGNRSHGVAIPHNYWSTREWNEAFRRLALVPAVWQTDLHLYPPAVDWIFGGSLHVVTRLERT